MELKSYQREVINDLIDFLEELENTKRIDVAFSTYWAKKGINLHSISNDYLKPYDNAIKGVPRVTVKVPTAGGKTFIACNALKPIFDYYPPGKPKVVAWFVPSDTILKQTLKNLNDPYHPYRQKINSHFGNAVRVYEKEELLFGQSFSPVEVQEQLSVFVLSVQSFAANNKDGRRVYRENENLMDFPKTYQFNDRLVEGADETALIQVISQLNPVVVIDESHNFEADLRIDLLNDINPSFIVDLTATPRNKSNIISFVDAMQLKKNNMVKLPVIVYNHRDTNEVIISAIKLQRELENKAIIEYENGGNYIRPIVLFQAQPNTGDDNVTFDKIKNQLVEIGIPENQIKIKTAQVDEIKNENLLSPDCEIRFIITINALKEGWDCPFAYILASLANKSSSVDVEQILGRILRLPYVKKNNDELLNLSYVFTSSNNFFVTLEKIISGLNKCGFSSKDYRINEKQNIKNNEIISQHDSLFSDSLDLDNSQTEGELDIDINKALQFSESDEMKEIISSVVDTAYTESNLYNKKIEDLGHEDLLIPTELMDVVKTYPVNEIFKDLVEDIEIPSFFIKVKNNSLFESQGSFVPLRKNLLLDGFDLNKQDSNIDFSISSSDLASIDLEEGRKDEYVPKFQKIIGENRQNFLQYITGLAPDAQIRHLATILARQSVQIDEIAQPQIINYIKSAIESLSSDKIAEIAEYDGYYSKIIKKKIVSLIDNYTEKQFNYLLDAGKVVCRPNFKFPSRIKPNSTRKGLIKNLYIEEGEMNNFEQDVIFKIASLDNVLFWHRNLERGKGFLINGFINHYPDFIVRMKNGMIILIEVKGNHLDGSDSLKKLRLGKKWASKAGENYRYFMVFEDERLEGAYTVNELVNIIKAMS